MCIRDRYFCSIAQELQDKTPDFGNYEEFVKGFPSPDSFFFKAVTESEMLKIINSLSFNKSTGDFSIPKQIFGTQRALKRPVDVL